MRCENLPRTNISEVLTSKADEHRDRDRSDDAGAFRLRGPTAMTHERRERRPKGDEHNPDWNAERGALRRDRPILQCRAGQDGLEEAERSGERTEDRGTTPEPWRTVDRVVSIRAEKSRRSRDHIVRERCAEGRCAAAYSSAASFHDHPRECGPALATRC